MSRATIIGCVVLGLFLALAGCQRKQEARTSGDFELPDTTFGKGYGGSSSPEADRPGGSPRGPEARRPGSERDKSDLPEIPEPPKIEIRIAEPATQGWGPSDLTFDQLGDKVARTMSGLAGIYGEATLMADNGDMSGKVTNIIKVKTAKDFAIEYNLPASPVRTNRLMGNASQGKAMLEDGEWKPMPQGGPSDLLETWSLTFPKQIFSGITSGKDTWKPLFESLEAGKGGFKASVEMRMVRPKDGSVPQKYYRLVAKRTEPRAEEVEIRFDATHFLPLAIRVKTTQKNGKKLDAQWQAKWTWSQPLKDSDFVLPRTM